MELISSACATGDAVRLAFLDCDGERARKEEERAARRATRVRLAAAHVSCDRERMPRRPAVAPRRRPRQARSGVTVDAVLVAAAEALAKHGFEGANVNDIAARAGVSIGSLYQYFPTKEAIVAALIERHTTRALDVLDDALAKSAGEPLEVAVRTVVGAMVLAHAAPGDRVLARELDRLGRLDDVQAAVDARAGAAIGAFLQARRSEIRIPRPELASVLLVRAVDLLTHAILVDRPELADADALIDELTALVLGYLTLARPARDER
jgi:AcrR family transcriptional regulator